MKWLKKWSYLLLMICTGIIYLSCVDEWQVYAKPVARIKEIYAEISGGIASGQSESGEADAEWDEPDAEWESQYSESEEAVTEPASEVSESEAQVPESESSLEAESSEVPESSEADGPFVKHNEDGTPVYSTVEDDYFADALFIGDSRTVGMFEYGGLENITTFYASTGLTVYKMFDSEIVSVPGQKKKITIEEALQQNSFKKIYLMIGINEMGTGNVDSFIAKYEEVVNHLLELQPDAIIYLQGIMKVTAERSAKGDYIHNEGIIARNERIAELADNERLFYLDVNPEVCDETGGMIKDYTFDGVHLKAQYIEIWKDFLKSHAIFLD